MPHRVHAPRGSAKIVESARARADAAGRTGDTSAQERRQRRTSSSTSRRATPRRSCSRRSRPRRRRHRRPRRSARRRSGRTSTPRRRTRSRADGRGDVHDRRGRQEQDRGVRDRPGRARHGERLRLHHGVHRRLERREHHAGLRDPRAALPGRRPAVVHHRLRLSRRACSDDDLSRWLLTSRSRSRCATPRPRACGSVARGWLDIEDGWAADDVGRPVEGRQHRVPRERRAPCRAGADPITVDGEAYRLRAYFEIGDGRERRSRSSREA
jgi:hypothetical protein